MALNCLLGRSTIYKTKIYRNGNIEPLTKNALIIENILNIPIDDSNTSILGVVLPN